MAEQRTKIVKIRLTPSEHEALMERKTTLHLAQWMREVCLAPDGKGTSPKRPPKADSDLLVALAQVTGSLNQLHIELNSQPTRSPFKTKKSQQALLESIDQSLKQLCDPILNPPSLRS